MSDEKWTVEQKENGEWIFRGPGGEIVGRFASPKIMASHFVFALQRVRDLQAIVDAINELREEEDDSLEIFRLPDIDGLLNDVVDVRAMWTNYACRRFSSETLSEALTAAVKAKREAAKAAGGDDGS